MLAARARVFIHVCKFHELPSAWNYAVNNSAGSFQYTPIFSLCHCAQHTMSEVLLITVFFVFVAACSPVLARSTHTILFCRRLLLGHWLLLLAALSLMSAYVASFAAFLDLVFMFQPSGLPYFREEALSCYFRLGHPSCLAGLIIRESPCWSSDCFRCPSEQSPVAFLEVLSAHWLAPIALLPNPGASLAIFMFGVPLWMSWSCLGCSLLVLPTLVMCCALVPAVLI